MYTPAQQVVRMVAVRGLSDVRYKGEAKHMSPFPIFLVVLIALIAIAIGLLLRRLLVQRLKKTVLDKWLIQTLGIVIILPPVILAGAAAPFILLNSLLIGILWDIFKQHVPDVTSLAWSFIQGILI